MRGSLEAQSGDQWTISCGKIDSLEKQLMSHERVV